MTDTRTITFNEYDKLRDEVEQHGTWMGSIVQRVVAQPPVHEMLLVQVDYRDGETILYQVI